VVITTSTGREITCNVANELQAQRLHIKPLAAAERLWERVLTAKERKRLGRELASCYRRLGGTAGMWMELHGVPYERAVIDVAYKLGFLRDSDRRWLLREIGEDIPPPSPDRPHWKPETGQLRFGDRVIRRVRVMARPSSIQRILDAFQTAGWPSSIDDPVAQGKHPEQVRQIVHFLNEGLDGMRFHVQKGGQAITWTRPVTGGPGESPSGARR
jgi:hypothetical protein